MCNIFWCKQPHRLHHFRYHTPAGFAGLATAYHLARFGSDVTVFDPNEAGAAGASSVAAGLLHPLTPRGKLIWKGEEGYKAAKHLIEVRGVVLQL